MIRFGQYTPYLHITESLFSSTANYEMTVDLTADFSRESDAILRPSITFDCDGQTMSIREVKRIGEATRSIRVHAEHISYFLADIEIGEIHKTNVDPHVLLTEVLTSTGFTVQPFSAPPIPLVRFKPKSVRDAVIRISHAINHRVAFRGNTVELIPKTRTGAPNITIEQGKNTIGELQLTHRSDGVKEYSVGVWSPEQLIHSGDLVRIVYPSMGIDDTLPVSNVSYDPVSYRGHSLQLRHAEIEGIVEGAENEIDRARDLYNQDIAYWQGEVSVTGFPADFPKFRVGLRFYVSRSDGRFELDGQFKPQGKPVEGYWHDPTIVYDEKGDQVMTYENTTDTFFRSGNYIFEVNPAAVNKISSAVKGAVDEEIYYYYLDNVRTAQNVKTPKWTGEGKDKHPVMKKMAINQSIRVLDISFAPGTTAGEYTTKDIAVRVAGVNVEIAYNRTQGGGGGCKVWITKSEEEMARIAPQVKKGDLVVAAWYSPHIGGGEDS